MCLFVKDSSCIHGINRAAQRCRFCDPDQMQITRRERIATELLAAGRGNAIECVEAADQLVRALDTFTPPSLEHSRT